MEDNKKSSSKGQDKNSKQEQPDKGKSTKKEMDLTEEDKEYKSNIDSMIEGLYLTDGDVRLNAYTMIKTEILSSTSSMTSIPRPLKFLRLHYEKLKEYFSSFQVISEQDAAFKVLLSDLLAVLVMVIPSTPDTSLSWVLTGTKKTITKWGPEFIKILCGDVATEYSKRLDDAQSVDDLYELVSIIIPYLIDLHSENEAIDLLIEVERLKDILEFVNQGNYKRICLYLMATANYAADTEELRSILELVYEIYFLKFKEYANALRVAIKIGNSLYIKQTLIQCPDANIKKQMAFILAREKIYLEGLPDDLQTILANLKISEYYKKVGQELDVLEPKHPEDFFKSHLEEKRVADPNKLESYKMNMASSIASAFINAGFGTEVLLGKKDASGTDWMSRNKEEGIISLLGGLGLVYLWDTLEGPGKLMDFAGNNERDPMRRGGRNVGMGIASTGIRDDNNTTVAFLTDELKDQNLTVKITSLFGLSIACAGSQNEDLKDPLLEILQDFKYGFEVSSLTSLCYGLTYLGSGNEDVFNDLFSILLTRNDGGKAKLFESPFFVLYALGMGLLCLGRQKDTDFMIETASTIKEFPAEMRMYLKTLLTACAYAGSGNVSKVQEMMHLIAMPKEEINPKVQSIAVICTSLIAIGEEVGCEMLVRSFNHFLQYGEVNVKKTVSLAMALLNLSNPKVTVVDNLTKFCYDSNKEIAMNAIFSLGLVSAGTNHSRIAGLFRNLAAFYAEETNPLFIIRISQGLLHLGKGLLTLNPVYSHNFLVNNVALSGILVAILTMTETESLICGKHQFLMYSLCLGMLPRMMITVDEKLDPKPIQVMVGQAVDIVGQSGNPRTITGFQVHNSPVLLSTGERCELSGDEFCSYTDVLENVVIIRSNPEFRKK